LSISGETAPRANGEISGAKCAAKSKAGNERKFRKIPFCVLPRAPRLQKQIEKLRRAKAFLIAIYGRLEIAKGWSRNRTKLEPSQQ
jgi:hypothetical protein